MDPRLFFENYQITDHEKDPLPLKVLRNTIVKEEIPGQAIHWGFDYLDQRQCPLPLINHILEKLHQEVLQADFSHCVEPSGENTDQFDSVHSQHLYEPLKLMRAVVKKLDEICLKEKEDYHDSVDGTVESPDMQPHVFAISYYNIKNTRRHMEDRMTILPRMDRLFQLPTPLSYFAVFDGHNGVEAAAYGATQLHQFLVQGLKQQQDVISSISDAFETLDEVFVNKCKSNDKIKSGSTVVLSLIMPEKLYVAWLGDSQAVLAKRNEVSNLVTPHKPERKDEIDRIRSLGGEVIQMHDTYRVNGNLAVSRAIGDVDQKTFIISTPDIKMLELDGSEEFLVLACDGLWDEISPETAANIVRRQVVADPSKVSSISQQLIQQAKQKGSSDNISVIVVFLEPVESIRNRYEGALEPEIESDVSILKQSPEPVGVVPMEKFIEHGLAELNGHAKEGEQAVDFLSFGSSKESAEKLVDNDAGNQSGDDIGAKEVEDDLSDAESDDEWQFEKPSVELINPSHNSTVTQPVVEDIIDVEAGKEQFSANITESSFNPFTTNQALVETAAGGEENKNNVDNNWNVVSSTAEGQVVYEEEKLPTVDQTPEVKPEDPQLVVLETQSDPPPTVVSNGEAGMFIIGSGAESSPGEVDLLIPVAAQVEPIIQPVVEDIVNFEAGNEQFSANITESSFNPFTTNQALTETAAGGEENKTNLDNSWFGVPSTAEGQVVYEEEKLPTVDQTPEVKPEDPQLVVLETQSDPPPTVVLNEEAGMFIIGSSSESSHEEVDPIPVVASMEPISQPVVEDIVNFEAGKEQFTANIAEPSFNPFTTNQAYAETAAGGEENKNNLDNNWYGVPSTDEGQVLYEEEKLEKLPTVDQTPEVKPEDPQPVVLETPRDLPPTVVSNGEPGMFIIGSGAESSPEEVDLLIPVAAQVEPLIQPVVEDIVNFEAGKEQFSANITEPSFNPFTTNQALTETAAGGEENKTNLDNSWFGVPSTAEGQVVYEEEKLPTVDQTPEVKPEDPQPVVLETPRDLPPTVVSNGGAGIFIIGSSAESSPEELDLPIPVVAQVEPISQTKAASKSVNKSAKTPTKPEAPTTKGKSPTTAAAPKKSPAKSSEEGPKAPGLVNGKPAVPKSAPKPTATPRPAATAKSVPATTTKPAGASRVGGATRTAPTKPVTGADKTASTATSRPATSTMRSRPVAAPPAPKPAAPKSTNTSANSNSSVTSPKKVPLAGTTTRTASSRPTTASTVSKVAGDAATKPAASAARTARPKPATTTSATASKVGGVGGDAKRPAGAAPKSATSTAKPTTTSTRPPVTRTVPTSSRTAPPAKPVSTATTNRPIARNGPKPAGDVSKPTGTTVASRSTPRPPVGSMAKAPTAPRKVEPTAMKSRKPTPTAPGSAASKTLKSTINKKVAAASAASSEKGELIQQNGVSSNEGNANVNELNVVNGGINGDVHGLNGETEKQDSIKENGVHLDDDHEPINPQESSSVSSAPIENLLG